MSILKVHRKEEYPTLTIPARSKVAYLNTVAKRRLEKEFPTFFHFISKDKIRLKSFKSIKDENIYRCSTNKVRIPVFLKSHKQQVFKLVIRGTSIRLLDVSQEYIVITV